MMLLLGGILLQWDWIYISYFGLQYTEVTTFSHSFYVTICISGFDSVTHWQDTLLEWEVEILAFCAWHYPTSRNSKPPQFILSGLEEMSKLLISQSTCVEKKNPVFQSLYRFNFSV